jgi:hypothetical protein
MKTAISIPDPVFRSAEELARRLGISRSELYTRAVAALLEDQRAESITARLNEIYGLDGNVVDPAIAAAQARAVLEGPGGRG